MRVAVIQLAYADGEPLPERRDRAAHLVRQQAGHDLVILPELWGAAVAREIGAMVHIGSIIETLPQPGAEGKSLANTSVVVGADGAVAAVYRKIHRFGFAAGEPALLEAGSDLVTVDLPGGHRAALSTCYDLRFPELYRRQLDAGAEVFLVPAAWPMARVEHWCTLGRARAIENQCVLIACNTAGTHGGYQMGGASQVVSAQGVVLAEAGPDEEVLSVDIDVDEVSAWRRDFPVLADRRL